MSGEGFGGAPLPEVAPHVAEYLALPMAEWVESEPYWGCPHCEGREYGAEHPGSDDPYIYRCHQCNRRFRGVPGVHLREQDWVAFVLTPAAGVSDSKADQDPGLPLRVARTGEEKQA